MNTQISYKNILKASAAAVFLLAAFFAFLIWIFGDQVELKTEITKSPSFSNIETFKQIPSPAPTNLTNNVSKVIAKELVENNPLGPVPNQAGVPQIDAIDPEALVETSIQEGFANFNPDEFRYQVDFSQIKMAESNLKENQSEYFRKINLGLKEIFKNSETINYDNLDQSNFAGIISRYDRAIAMLYQIEVPSDLLKYHISLISLLGTHKNVYAVIANIDEDPLQAYLIAEFGLQVEGELVFLTSEMNQYIEDNNLEL